MNQELVKNSIVDIEEFCKLYKLNIPIAKEFQYYVDTLKKSQEFNHIDSLIKHFGDLEEFVSNNGYKSVRDYKNECLDALKDHLVSTQAYKSMMETEMPKQKMFCRDHINSVEETDFLVSLDFVSANYSILKTFETGDGELENTWIDLCKKFNVHEALIKSKSFRQVVFGNTSPKRLQTFQHDKIMALLNYAKATAGVEDERIVFISHDEIVIKFKHADSLVIFSEKHLVPMERLVNMNIKLTPYSLKKIKKNTFVKTLLGVNPKTGIAATTNQGMYYFNENFNSLHGVPGHKFYMYFKKYILGKDLDERDLMYMNDGELCLWFSEDFKKPKKNLPHYDKPKIVVSLKESMSEYSYLWKQMEDKIPDLSNEEKRRMIEIIANTCKACLSDKITCTCWKEE